MRWSMGWRLWTLASLLLTAAAQQAADDPRLLACRRPGWVFLQGLQQRSWQAIMNCSPFREPGIQCAKDKQCFGWTSNGNEGSGWLYRLPRARQCGPVDNLQAFEWEWSWGWVPMKCMDKGPCCGTYIAHDAGTDPSFSVSCSDGASGSAGGGGSASRSCPNWCPKLLATHDFYTPELFEVECSKQKADAGVSGQRRRLAAGGGGMGEAAKRAYLAVLSKTPTAASQTSQPQSFVRQQGSSQCLSVARTCGTLAKS